MYDCLIHVSIKIIEIIVRGLRDEVILSLNFRKENSKLLETITVMLDMVQYRKAISRYVMSGIKIAKEEIFVFLR